MAVDMFLKIGDIKGESRDDKHKDEIDVLAWSWGMSQSGTTHTGAGGGAGKVNVQDMSLTKYVDKASPESCWGRAATASTSRRRLLTVRKAGDKPLEYIKITMKDVLITSVSTGGSGGEDRFTENVSLNFGEFKYEYTPQKADGSGDAAVDFTFDIAANEAEK